MTSMLLTSHIFLSYRRWFVVLTALLLLDPLVHVAARGGRGGGGGGGGGRGRTGSSSSSTSTTSTSTTTGSSSNTGFGAGAGFVAGSSFNRNRNRNFNRRGDGNFTDDEFMLDDGNFTGTDDFTVTQISGSSSSDSTINLVPIVAIVGGLLFAVLCCVGICKQFSNSESSPSEEQTTSSFASNKYSVALQAAKDTVIAECQQGSDGADMEAVPVAPSDGTYELTYQEKGESFTSTHEFTFRSALNHAAGWDISGKGRDPDGTFVITEGLVAPSGQAYWVEQSSDGLSFSKGQFVLPAPTAAAPFTSGAWMADNGASGLYIDSKSFVDGDGVTSINSSEQEPDIAFDLAK